jgi:hypothetical protein
MINSRTVPSFWESYHELPDSVRKAVRKAFGLWKDNPFHPSLRFKCVESKTHVWSLRISSVIEHFAYLKGIRQPGFGLETMLAMIV